MTYRNSTAFYLRTFPDFRHLALDNYEFHSPGVNLINTLGVPTSFVLQN